MLAWLFGLALLIAIVIFVASMFLAMMVTYPWTIAVFVVIGYLALRWWHKNAR